MSDKHPLRDDPKIHRKTYEALCKKLCRFYGVQDAERFYQSRRKAIHDNCEPDEFGWGRHESLKDWHQAMSMERFARAKDRAIKAGL